MPVNSGISASSSNRANQLSKMGSRIMAINGISRVDMRTDYGSSGVSAVAASGRIDSGGPTFNSQSQKFKGYFTISGITKDSSGSSLGSCDVTLYQTGSDSVLGKTVSDGSGNYSFSISSNSGNFYVVSYKSGSPDVAGTTVNTLVAI